MSESAENKVVLPSKREVAYHEAGHAFGAVVFKFYFSYVTVKPTKSPEVESLGKLRVHFRRNHRMTHSKKEELAIVIFMGELAEKRACAYSEEEILTNDLVQVLSLFKNEESSDVMVKHLRYLRAKANELINDDLSWHCISAIAEELMQKETLKRSEVRQIVCMAHLNFMDLKSGNAQPTPPAV